MTENSTCLTLTNDETKEKIYSGSMIENEGMHDWDSVLFIAGVIINNLENDADIINGNSTIKKDIDIASMKYKIQYFSALIVTHTKPLKDVKYCLAYNLIASVLESGDFMIFGDWCLYYGLTESAFIERWKTDKELQLVWIFFDTLYNKLASLRIIDNNTLKRYESSRASGHFLPYSERAVIVDTVSKNEKMLDRGKDVLSELMGG